MTIGGETPRGKTLAVIQVENKGKSLPGRPTAEFIGDTGLVLRKSAQIAQISITN